MRRCSRVRLKKACLALGLVVLAAWPALNAIAGEAKDDDHTLAFVLRSRVESPPGSGKFVAVEREAEWETGETAIIVCDMWDLHHCLNATRRGVELAMRMDPVLRAARDRGVLVIHAPSSCMGSYTDHPARKRAQATPRPSHLPKDIGQGCTQIASEERGVYPIDQSDGGEDDDPAEHAHWAARLSAMGRDPKAPWKKQTDKLWIDPENDFISDSGEEIWSILQARGIEHVILLGVHTNMCVLGRPFGLRQMVKHGKDAALMRDMTDTMYNPERAPHVNHFEGTDRIVEHIEKYVCPSISSEQLVGGKPFRYSGDDRTRVVFVIAEDEYETDRTLPEFASRMLGGAFRTSFLLGAPGERNRLAAPGLLDEADVALISVRRRPLPPAQLAAVRRFVAQGKPVVGIRTASHAFAPVPKTPLGDGLAAWIEFDSEVLGGNYKGHLGDGPKAKVTLAEGASHHPIVAGLDVAGIVGNGSLYRVSPLASSTTPLLIGKTEGHDAEPVAWTNLSSAGGRVFYTSLGDPDDFREPEFCNLLRNAICWTAGRDELLNQPRTK